MDASTREKGLRISLLVFGVIFFLVYPLALIWPSGWVWHGGEGQYYFQMIVGIYAVLGGFLIAAARNPSAHHAKARKPKLFFDPLGGASVKSLMQSQMPNSHLQARLRGL